MKLMITRPHPTGKRVDIMIPNPICFLKYMRAKHEFYTRAELHGELRLGSAARCTNLAHNKSNVVVGAHSYIQGSIYVCDNGKITIGDYFFLGPRSFIGAFESIEIGKCVIIANDVKIYDNNNHPTDPQAREKMSLGGYCNENWSWKWAAHSPVVIQDTVWIGQHSLILKGVTIGKGSIVAAASVVTKDVPPYCIVAGNPARVVKWITPTDRGYEQVP